MTETVTHQAVMVAPKATGLACLVLVGRLHGLNLSVEQLVHDNHLVMGEIDGRQLLRCATRAGFRCNLLALDWGSVLELRNAFPAIAVLTDKSSVVIAGTTVRDGVAQLLVQSPLAGAEPMAVDRARFEEVWTGDILLLRRNVETVENAVPFGFRLIASLMFQNPREVWEIGLSALALSVFALTPMIFWVLLSSSVLNNLAAHTFVLVCVGGAVFVLFEGAFLALRRWVVLRLTARIDFTLSTLMFERLLNLPIDYFETTPLGRITYRIGQMGKIRAFMTGQLFGTVLDAGVLLIFLPIMFYLSPILTAIVLGFCSLSAAWIIAVLPLYRRRTRAVEEAESDRLAFLAQTVSGMRTIKSLALDSLQQRRWDGLTALTARRRLAEGNLRNVIQTVVTPIERLTMVAPISIGIYLAITRVNSISMGLLFVFVLLSQRLVAPLLQLAQLVQQYDDARSAVELVGDLLNRPAEEGRSGHGVRVPLRGHVEFVNLRFTYQGAANPALRSISFEIPQGTTLGVMGRSGSGKTTITRLLQRLHSDYQGMIRIDGVDVREYDIDHLRSSLGVVLQENFLFSGTIRDNITVAKSDATFEEVVNAARLAGAEEFIDKLPRGYETVIYEGSPNLSGGQRQRLAIARALITDPKVLILDEATSALDADSEAIVNANLRRIAQGRTMIVISHRLSSLVSSDAILVLDQGEVHDIGKHHELLERCDIYSGLWYRQQPHAEEDAAQPAPAPKLIARGASGA